MRDSPLLAARVDRSLLRSAVVLGTAQGLAGAGAAYFLAGAVAALVQGRAGSAASPILGAVFLALVRFGLQAGQAAAGQALARRGAGALRADFTGLLRGGGAGNLELWGRGIDSTEAWFASYLPQTRLAFIIPALVFSVALVADPLSALVLLISLPLLPLFLWMIGIDAREETRLRWKELTRQGGLYLETLRGLPTLKQLGLSGAWAEVLGAGARLLRESTLGVLRLAFLSALVLELVGTLGTALVAVEAGLRLIGGGLDFRHAFFVILLAPEFYGPLRLLGLYRHAALDADRVAAELAGESAPVRDGAARAREGETAAVEGKVDLRARGLGFTWPGASRPALEGIDLEIARGEFLAIGGASGSGKSCLLALLAGLREASAGRLERRPGLGLAWIPQFPRIYNRSLRSNLLLLPEPSKDRDEELIQALGRVGLIPLLRSLPEGLDTLAGEGPGRLSGGEARRLALARALLSGAGLILLDEPEAHLDAGSRRGLETLLASLAGTTRVLVTHAEPTLAAADRVLFLEGGRVRGLGPHAELLAASPAWRSLVAGGRP